MRINEFGKAVRKARLDAEVSLAAMAEELEVSSTFLSGMETGRKKISAEWVQKVENFFLRRQLDVPGLAEMADISNKSVSLEGLAPAHQSLIAGFARASLSVEQVERFKEMLNSLNENKQGDPT